MSTATLSDGTPVPVCKSQSNTERFGRVTSLLMTVGVNRVEAELYHGNGTRYSVYVSAMTPDRRAWCGMAFAAVGSVEGGRGVAQRVLDLGMANLGRIAEKHDPATCGVCKGRAAADTTDAA